MRQLVDLVGRQAQAARGACGGKRRLRRQLARNGGNVGGVGPAAIGAARQQHAQLFKALADGGHGVGQARVGLRGAAVGQRVAGAVAVLGLDAAAGKDIGAGDKAGLVRSARHQDLQHRAAGDGGIAQQQHGGGIQGRDGFTVGVELLAEAWHRRIMGKPG